MTDIRDVRAAEIGQGELWEEKKVDLLWFHVVRGLINKGEIAKIGAVAWAVYTVIKAHTNLNTGDAAPSVQRIAELVGCSHDTTQRALKVLVNRDLIQVAKRGRQNIYSLTERFEITEKTGEPYATAVRQYNPSQFADLLRELKRFAQTGNLPTDRAVTFNLNVTVNNIQQGDHGNVTIGDIQNVRVEGDVTGASSTEDVTSLLRRRLKSLE